jgi:hypothetical protein
MFPRATTFFAAALLLLAPVASQAALASYTQDFETLVQLDPLALANNGWVVYGNVFTPAHVFIRGYGVFGAPNGTSAFCDIASGQGGLPQGLQQLAVYSDYGNTLDQLALNLVEANVYHEQTIAAGDVGARWTFQFDAKLGNLVAPSTAFAFIKTLNPLAGYATTNYRPLETTAIPGTWGTYTITIPIDAGLVGQLLQFGFSSTATNYVASAVMYDNIFFFKEVAGVGDANRAGVMELRPAAPNPFTNSTRLDYAMAQPGAADLTVYDVTGRRIATLFHGVANAGSHTATWDGRSSSGQLAPVGVYDAVLQTSAGRTTRRLVLSR